MRQPAYTEHLIYAPQLCFNSDTPPKRLYTEMHTADWWWVTQLSRDSRDNNVLIEVKATLRMRDTLVPLIFLSDGTHLSNIAVNKKN